MSRITGSKKTAHTVLIVCEGKNTEPSYFESLESYIRDKYSDHYPNGITFDIFPIGPETQEAIKQESELFSRKKTTRVVKNAEQIINEDIEEEYSPAPIRWVRYAQKQSINVGYNQVWSVFDYDNRSASHIEKSFNQAETATTDGIDKVQIAYSSYSFEYWILLHYELYEKYLGFSECKDEKREPIACGTKAHSDDCNGNKCLTGYLYLNDPKVGSILKTEESTFPYIKENMRKACIRAKYMRTLHSKETTNKWEMKPVTTMDEMLESLIPGLNNITWHLATNEIVFTNWKISWSRNESLLTIKLITNGRETVLINAYNICLYDEKLDHDGVNQRILKQGQGEYDIVEIDISKLDIIPCYISIKKGVDTHFSKL
ncbi:MAG: RloB family protein [Bacteroidales bacterium]|jgi:hypothetical protein|nr:RloB family protein [Bacteroidales bacterium]